MGIGLCVLAAPELIVGAVIVTGVVVGFAIKEALDAYELKGVEPEEVRPSPETKPVSETKPAPQDPLGERRPKPEPKGPDFPPLGPIETSERERRPECTPIPVPHLGGNDSHNECADKIPNNSFPGWDVLVHGKNFGVFGTSSGQQHGPARPCAWGGAERGPRGRSPCESSSHE